MSSIYSCDGSNVSPPIVISEVPQNTESLALIMEDPDAPGGTFTHWLLWNIDPKTSLISEGLTPDGTVRGTNSMGHLSYDGPCPPSGTHRYFFKVFALDTSLDLETGSDYEDLKNAIKNHVKEEAEMVGLYSR